MKSIKVLSIAAVAAVLVSTLAFSSEVYATSRTTTLEVAGAARTTTQPSQGAQVLGETREGVVTEEVTVSQITNQEAKAVLNDMNAVADIVASSGVEVAQNNLTILDSMEITPKAGVVVSEANPLFVSFSFPGVTAKTRAFVFHFVNGKWVVVPTKIENGLIVGKFTSFSPVAVVVDKTTLDTSVLGASKATSPRTGDVNYWIIALSVVGAAVASTAAIRTGKRA